MRSKPTPRNTAPGAAKILGVDPGYERLGVALVVGATVPFSACWQASKTLGFGERLVKLGALFAELLDAEAPDLVAIERLFVTKNQKTASGVSELRGVLVYEAAKRQIPLAEFTPQQIKLAITGSGAAAKDQVARMVDRLITLETRRRLDDEYDAIAIALTAQAHGLSTRPS